MSKAVLIVFGLVILVLGILSVIPGIIEVPLWHGIVEIVVGALGLIFALTDRKKKATPAQ